MTYYKDTDYKEHYYTEFKDREGGLWHVSIQDPTFIGQATQLTAGENPLEWMGSGDGKQDECILGSTGYLRLVCKTGEESIYNLAGNLRPSSVNDRRVIATRNSVIMWAGYIACEDYSQAWESAPYEVELPLVSMLAVAEKFTMPKFGTQEDVTDIAGLLRYVARLLAVPGSEEDSTYAHGQFATNNPFYYDFRGSTKYVGEGDDRHIVHWTQGICYTSYYYDRGECYITPMTLKEVLETILYPYGHIREHGANWMIRMDGALGMAQQLWVMTMEGTENMFAHTTDAYMDTYELSTQVTILSDGNTLSTLAAPSTVTFSDTSNDTNVIMKPDGSWIKSDKQLLQADMVIDASSTYYRATSMIDENDIDTDYVSIDSTSGLTQAGKPFARTIEMTKDDNKAYQFSTKLPFGFNMSCEAGDTALVVIKPVVNVISISGYCKIKMHIKRYNGYEVGYCIRCDGKELKSDGSWQTAGTSKSYITNSSEEFDVLFNEPRGTADMNLKQLYITLKNYNKIVDLDQYVSVELEYVEDVQNSTYNLEYSMVEDAVKKDNEVSVGGYGDSINIKFKTMRSRTFRADGGTAEMPHNGFCDDRLHIDTGQRKKLEIEACNVSNPTYLVRFPCIITDGDINYIPVAVGMNARDCTTQLKLVSTNI